MLSRRSFLRAAAASAAAPAVLVRPAGAVTATDAVRLGFIGVGTMGRGHLAGFLSRKEIQVAAVCDVVKDRLDAAAEMVAKRTGAKTKSGTAAACKTYADFR